jgi:glycosyltransferase 2 family protein
MGRLRILAALVGTLIAVVLALSILDWASLARAVAQLSFGVLAAATTLSLLATLLLSIRWSVLAAPPNVLFGRREFRDALISQVFNLITPAAAGADAYRVVIAGDREGGRGRAAGLVILERIIGIGGYALVFVFCYAMSAAYGRPAVVFSAAVSIFAVLATIPFVSMFFARLIALHKHLWLEARLPVTIKAILAAVVGVLPARAAAALGLSILGTVMWLICLMVLGSATEIGLDHEVVGMIAIITEFSRLLPISFQGIGVREATFAFLASQAGGSSEAAFAACATAYALHFALVTVVAFAARYGFDFLPRLTREAKQVAAQFVRGLR